MSPENAPLGDFRDQRRCKKFSRSRTVPQGEERNRVSGGKLAAQFGTARQKERDVGYHRRRSSGTLARQAEAGAPFAIFVSRGRALHVTKRGSRIMRVENAKKVLAAHYHGLGHDGGRKGSPRRVKPASHQALGVARSHSQGSGARGVRTSLAKPPPPGKWSR